jgi:pimeloyl-ACP methyl ester carboxylesterase
MPTWKVETPDGVALHVVDLSPDAEGPPLVVLHGGPAAHHDYLLPAFATLAHERRVLLYDQRGGGQSPARAGTDLSWQAHVADVGEILHRLGLARADVCGYSFGGLYALLFALRAPERVRKLLLCSSVPPWHGYRQGLAKALADAQSSAHCQREREALERSELREHLPAEYRRRRFALSVAGYFADPRLAYALTPFLVQARAAEAVSDSLGDFDFRAELVPRSDTLVVHGEEDPIDPAYARDTAARLHARLELIPGCAHVPYLEAPEHFFAILEAFLST